MTSFTNSARFVAIYLFKEKEPRGDMQDCGTVNNKALRHLCAECLHPWFSDDIFNGL